MDGEVLKVGQQIPLGPYQCQVAKILGDGNQGEVAMVRIDGETYALKWYKPEVARDDQYENLRMLAQKGPPDATTFLWPLAVGRVKGMPAFGYLMPFREARFKEASQYLLGNFTVRRRQMAAALAQIAHGLFLVNQQGLCYCDISENNFAFDPDTGEIRVFDNDNVKIDNKAAAHHTDGTPGFMAPEVVRGEAKPNKETDRFGLSVLLFQLLVWGHPYEGALIESIPGWDDTKDLQIYGKPAPFVFDPADATNRPVDELADSKTKRWRDLPNFLQERFHNAFSAVVNEPHRRDTTLTWRHNLLRLHDAVVPCPACKAETYYDGHKREDRDLGPCAGCGRPIPVPPRLRLTHGNDQAVLPLTETTRLYAAHLLAEEHWDLTKPLAEVKPHPKQPGIYGLANLGTTPWTGVNPDGHFFDVRPGTAVVIKNHMKIDFGPEAKGEFRT